MSSHVSPHLSGIALVLGLSLLSFGAQAQYDRPIRCDSNDNRHQQCPADTSRGVQLSRQISKTACVEGRTWGYDRNVIWVNGGCRAEFVLGGGRRWGGGGGGHWGGGGGWTGDGEVVRCDSNDGDHRSCRMNGTRARLQRQISKTRCVEGDNWGYSPGEIWVDDGCRAEFIVDRGRGGWGGGGWNGGGGGWNNGGGGGWGQAQTLYCGSDDHDRRRCNVSIRRDARLIRQQSRAACIEGDTWGWDRNGIWVDEGCRGQFSVR